MAEANSAPWCFVVWLKWLYPDLYASCILAPAFSRGMIDDSSDLDKLSGQTTKPSVNSCESSWARGMRRSTRRRQRRHHPIDSKRVAGENEIVRNQKGLRSSGTNEHFAPAGGPALALLIWPSLGSLKKMEDSTRVVSTLNHLRTVSQSSTGPFSSLTGLLAREQAASSNRSPYCSHLRWRKRNGGIEVVLRRSGCFSVVQRNSLELFQVELRSSVCVWI